ncbi:MAG: hypothetical protein AMXMBFR7_35870 [Planctomycetota bacterium]
MDAFLQAWIIPPETSAEPWVYITTAVVALALTAVSKGGFGGGVGIVSVPLMLQVAPAHFVVGLWLPVLISCDLATIHHYPKQWSPRAAFQLAPGMLLGIAGTTVLLSWVVTNPDSPETKATQALHEAWLKLGIAAVGFVFVALRWAPQAKEDAEPWKPNWIVSFPIGFVAGVTTTVAHAAGTIITMFLLPQKLDKRVFVGTTGRYFFAFNSLKVPFMLAIGWINIDTLKYGLWLMLLAPLGVGFGSWLNHRLSAARFTQWIFIFLVLACGKLVYDGVRVIR